MLNKGDPVKVRLHTGEVVEAVYSHREPELHIHSVLSGGAELLALDAHHLKRRQGGLMKHECRLIGNPCVLVPMGVSV